MNMPSTIKVEIKRQSNPNASATTEKFEVPYRPNMINHTTSAAELTGQPPR
jgi:succinate dehydrogenase / fumarate reductase, iron-sulfur subunit